MVWDIYDVVAENKSYWKPVGKQNRILWRFKGDTAP